MKRHGKLAALLLAAALLLTLAVNGAMAEGAKTLGTKIVGLSDQTAGAEWNQNLEKSFRELFENAGYKVIITAAEGSPTQQVTDIENLVASGCEYIYVCPTDPESLIDSMIAAREAGVMVFGQSKYSNPEAYDATMRMDMFELGQTAAQTALSWVDAAYPDAKEGSIDTILITRRTSTNDGLRCDGLETIKNDPRINVVDTYEVGAGGGAADVYNYMEAAISKYPNTKLYLCYDGSYGVSANEVIMQSGLPIEEICIVATGSGTDTLKCIQDSAEGNAAYRYCIDMENTAAVAFNAWNMILEGTLPEDKAVDMGFYTISAENVEQYIK